MQGGGIEALQWLGSREERKPNRTDGKGKDAAVSWLCSKSLHFSCGQWGCHGALQQDNTVLGNKIKKLHSRISVLHGSQTANEWERS